MLLLKRIATWCHSCPAEVGPTGHLPASSHPVAHEAWNTQLSISGVVLQVNFSVSDTLCGWSCDLCVGGQADPWVFLLHDPTVNAHV